MQIMMQSMLSNNTNK